MSKVKYLSVRAFNRENAHKIAYQRCRGKGPGLIFCGGLKSDMHGTKASALHAWAQEHGRAFVRFDYYGHGASSGVFARGTISRWRDDTLRVIDELSQGAQILIGSSMGGWTALLAALARPERVRALVLIAPAPDFTEDLMWKNYSADIRKTIMEDGIYYQPSDYDEPYEISRDLILDGRKNLLLGAPIKFDGPVHIIQGMQDTSVPWQHALRIVDALNTQRAVLSLIKNGDHSLSDPEDLHRIFTAIQSAERLLSG